MPFTDTSHLLRLTSHIPGAVTRGDVGCSGRVRGQTRGREAVRGVAAGAAARGREARPAGAERGRLSASASASASAVASWPLRPAGPAPRPVGPALRPVGRALRPVGPALGSLGPAPRPVGCDATRCEGDGAPPRVLQPQRWDALSGLGSGAVAGLCFAAQADVAAGPAAAAGAAIGAATTFAWRAAFGGALSDLLQGRADPYVTDFFGGAVAGLLGLGLLVVESPEAAERLGDPGSLALSCASLGFLSFSLARAGLGIARAAVTGTCTVPEVDPAAEAVISARQSTPRGSQLVRVARHMLETGESDAACREAHILAAEAGDATSTATDADVAATVAAAYRLIARCLEPEPLRSFDAFQYRQGSAGWRRRAGQAAVLPWLEAAHQALEVGAMAPTLALLLEEALAQTHTPAQAEEIEALRRRAALRMAATPAVRR